MSRKTDDKPTEKSTPIRVPNELVDDVKSYIKFWKAQQKLTSNTAAEMEQFSKDTGVLLRDKEIIIPLKD